MHARRRPAETDAAMVVESAEGITTFAGAKADPDNVTRRWIEGLAAEIFDGYKVNNYLRQRLDQTELALAKTDDAQLELVEAEVEAEATSPSATP